MLAGRASRQGPGGKREWKLHRLLLAAVCDLPVSYRRLDFTLLSFSSRAHSSQPSSAIPNHNGRPNRRPSFPCPGPSPQRANHHRSNQGPSLRAKQQSPVHPHTPAAVTLVDPPPISHHPRRRRPPRRPTNNNSCFCRTTASRETPSRTSNRATPTHNPRPPCPPKPPHSLRLSSSPSTSP
ncbi:uncharacterized protein K452DRAFT_165231 [Aplosporella prunicola CBS 121167]|uniref:Uncharacterized protein n=1 Tax=Aplosporella prunicola CBS 121167 TaxID=1176127 RepID=A0A6A6AVU1_9PEZI|nr:uncharacterized protein K452DRAFT_165231 [Aplosporella prunicola CBS 121167]KAF2135716.1 hypothetical protein K452DRAFT_165231 [Aplosporella prunicola CBS 121167]